jgi:threonylcarbamoyladenosine tRNA methylthiotransferase CDKAL1
MSNIYIETYGCSVSLGESEIMAGLLEQAGFNVVRNEKIADLIIVITCYVKTPTEQRILFRLKELQEKYPDKKLIISGCMPEGIYNKLVDIAPDASLVSTHHITKIVNAVKKTLEGKRVEFLGESDEIKLCLPKIRKNPLIGIVPISSGCNSNCSYCCVRIAKGKLFSYPKEKIIKEVSNCINQGCKEIWITSQDNASYKDLPELMNEISRIPGNFFVRIGMMNPNNVLPMLPDLIKAYKNYKIYNFLHLPVQSGDNEILSRMNRGYNIGDFERIVREFEENLNYQLWTDVIVGFPGETEEQFNTTLELIKRVRPDWVNVSKYGSRPDTPASKLDQLDPKVMNKRSLILSNLVREISLEKNKKWIGWKGKILISKRGKKENQWFGRNFAYKPVLIEEKNKILGKFLDVKIIEAERSYLLAECV